MDEDLEITGTTVGDVSYVVAYYDVNTNNVYDGNGNLFGNTSLSATLSNAFILELHYVKDVSTSENPADWSAWDGLTGMAVASTLSFDDDYVHAVEASVVTSATIGAHTVRINVPEISKDVLSSSGNLVFNPFGITPTTVSYDAVSYVSGTVFDFSIAGSQGLPIDVTGGDNPTLVRVSEPTYLFIDANSIYEHNIPNRYGEGIFKIPLNITSRKLLKALDYTGVLRISGTMEHNIYIKQKSISGMKTGSNTTYVRDSSGDTVAIDSSDNKSYQFCKWSNSLYTKGNNIHVGGGQLYQISGGSASLQGTSISEVVYNTSSVLFRTFTFPFVINNLVSDSDSSVVSVQDTLWSQA